MMKIDLLLWVGGSWPRDDQVVLIICCRNCLCLSDFIWCRASEILTVRNKAKD